MTNEITKQKDIGVFIPNNLKANKKANFINKKGTIKIQRKIDTVHLIFKKFNFRKKNNKRFRSLNKTMESSDCARTSKTPAILTCKFIVLNRVGDKPPSLVKKNSLANEAYKNASYLPLKQLSCCSLQIILIY